MEPCHEAIAPAASDGGARLLSYVRWQLGLRSCGGRTNRTETRPMRRIEITDKGTLELANGVLRLRWKPGMTVGLDDAQGARAAVDALGQGTSLPMLIHVHGVRFSAEARRVFPSPSSVSRIALLGSSPVDQVIALFLLRICPLPCPVMYFTAEKKAAAWLRRGSALPADR